MIMSRGSVMLDKEDTTTTPHPPPNVVQQNGATTHVKSAEQSKESLHQLCSQLHDKISAFLASTPETELLRQVQHQTKISLQVVQEALQRYSFVYPPPHFAAHQAIYRQLKLPTDSMNSPSHLTVAKIALYC